MEVRIKKGYWVDPARMMKQIKDAGYTPVPENVELRVSGRVVRREAGLAIELDQVRSPVTLRVAAAKGNEETAAHLERHADQTVEVEGLWTASPDGQPGAGSLAVIAIHRCEDRK